MSNYKVDITGINTSNLKCLTHEENIKLFKLYQAGDLNAKEDIVNGNLKLVLSVLKNFSKTGINQDDLFQVGVIGLIKAVDNFDLSYNLKLSTYAVPLIIGEIKKYLRDNTQMRIARSIKDDAYKILRFKEDFINKNGREPKCYEIASSLSMSEYDVGFALDSLKDPVIIFEPVYNDGDNAIYLEERLADNKKGSIDNDTMIGLYKALNKINDREKNILLERYVIGKTQTEIAGTLNISQAQVSRIEKCALSKVRRLIK